MIREILTRFADLVPRRSAPAAPTVRLITDNAETVAPELTVVYPQSNGTNATVTALHWHEHTTGDGRP